jgi:pseudooxynicotine oxidase
MDKNVRTEPAGITRRELLQGTASAGALLAAGTAGFGRSEVASAARKAASQADYDVMVIGGGFSGVAAARDCRKNGLKTLLVEARNRLGGRTFDTQFGEYHVELGGTWVHWTQPFVWSEIQRYGLEVGETPGAVPERLIALVDGAPVELLTPEKMTQVVEGFHEYFAEARPVWERPFDTHYRWKEIEKRDRMTAADRLKQVKLTPVQREPVIALLEGMANCPIDQASYVEMLRWYALPGFDFQQLTDSGGRYTIKDGTGALIRCMIDDGKPEVLLSKPIRRVERQDDVVVATATSGESLTARAAILALPMNVLREIEYVPSLNTAKLAASAERHSGSGIKAYIELKGLFGNIQLLGRAQHRLGVAVTYASRPGRTLLVGFGATADGFDGNDEEDVQRVIRQYLPDAEVLSCTSYAWNADPFARGTWCNYRPGQFMKYFDALRQDEGRFFMAGADIGSGWRGFIDGAIGNGIEAAERVSKFLLA